MDFFSHGLWTGLIFRKEKRIFWPIFFGLAPDFFSFGIYFFALLFFDGNMVLDQAGKHLSGVIPPYVDILYGATHSFVIFATIFLLIWFWRQKPFWPMLAWGVHIAIDIPLHSAEFFPTPFLFPLSSFSFSAFQWNNVGFLIVNYLVLAILYFSIFIFKNKNKSFRDYFKEDRKINKK